MSDLKQELELDGVIIAKVLRNSIPEKLYYLFPDGHMVEAFKSWREDNDVQMVSINNYVEMLFHQGVATVVLDKLTPPKPAPMWCLDCAHIRGRDTKCYGCGGYSFTYNEAEGGRYSKPVSSRRQREVYPPISKSVWLRNRLMDLNAGIQRYVDANLEVPDWLIAERTELIREGVKV